MLFFKDYYPIHESPRIHSGQQYQTQTLAAPQDFVNGDAGKKVKKSSGERGISKFKVS